MHSAVVARNIEGPSSTSFGGALVVLVINFLGTCSFVVVKRDAAALAVVVSRVLLKVTVHTGGGTRSDRIFLLGSSLLVSVLGMDRTLGFQCPGFHCLRITRHIGRSQCCFRCG